jgi:hypothetical protein
MGWHVGNAFKNMSRDLDKAAVGFGGVRLKHSGRPKTGDVPLLIKALSVRAPGVAEDARASLVHLAGTDYGPDPAQWQAWWRSRARQRPAVDDDLAEARALFSGLRNGFLSGDLHAILSTFSKALLRRWNRENLGRFLRRSEVPLRKAYRGARVRGLRSRDPRGSLVIDWGDWGFDFSGLPLVLEGGRWKVAARPWSRRVVRTGRAVEAGKRTGTGSASPGARASNEKVRGWIDRASRRRWASTATMLAVFLACLGIWASASLGLESRDELVQAAVHVGLPVICAALIAWTVFRGFRTSRDIRREFRGKHGGYSPTARSLR